MRQFLKLPLGFLSAFTTPESGMRIGSWGIILEREGGGWALGDLNKYYAK